MEGLSLGLKSLDNGGIMHLVCTREDNDFCFTLLGKHKDDHIQIDFDCVSKETIKSIIALLSAYDDFK